MSNEEENHHGLLTLEVNLTDADQVSDWIRNTLNKEPVEGSRPHADQVQIDIYFDTLIEAEIAHKALPSELNIRAAYARTYRAQDWTTFWRHHFKTIDLGRTLRIIPEWETIPDDGKTNIIINPGLSFGTGGHFTTRFCLEALEEAIDTFHPQSMIDAGTGSGILSIAANKLGIPDIIAFDTDPVCIEQSEANAARNGVQDQIHFFTADVLEPEWASKPAELVCANILTSVLLEAAILLKRSATRRIILSGIREIEADAVADTFIQLGCREVGRDGDGQWCGIVIDV